MQDFFAPKKTVEKKTIVDSQEKSPDSLNAQEKQLQGFFAPTTKAPPKPKVPSEMVAKATEKDATLDSKMEVLLKAADLSDPKAFKEVFDTIDKKELMEVVPKLLNEVAPRLSNEKSAFVLKMLKREYPELGKLLHSDKNNEILTPDGIRVVLDHLKEKGSLKTDCIVCDDIADFLKKWDDVEKAEVGSKFSFIVRCRAAVGGADGAAVHVTPIYIEKKSATEFNVLCTDAVGSKNLTSTTKLMDSWDKKVKEKEYKLNKFEPEATRQKDGSSCPIFAIRDMVNISRHPDIFNYLENRTADDPPLPPEMMISSQEPKSIKDIKSDTKLKTTNEATFGEKIDKHKYVLQGKGKEVNNLVGERSQKYQRLILENFFEKKE